jgi:hypothetical protein
MLSTMSIQKDRCIVESTDCVPVHIVFAKYNFNRITDIISLFRQIQDSSQYIRT